MAEEPSPGSWLDRLVEGAIGLLGSFGVNTTRMRWRWNQYRTRMAQGRLDAANRARGLTGKHRMCPSCRALVPVGQRTCSECGESLAGVSGPGPGRLLSWLLPGVPPASAAILTANFAIFLLIGLRAGFEPMESGGGLFSMLFHLLSFSSDTLVRYGAGNNYLLIVGAGLGTFLEQEWWRLVCPVFLHGGLLHLLFNTFVFVQIGPLLEKEYGKEKFFVLYLWCGVVSFLASILLRFWLFGPTARGYVNTIGASGAIFGLVGAALIYGGRRGGLFGRNLKATMVQWTIYLLIWTFLFPGIDIWAHLGGLAAGLGFAAAVTAGPPRNRSTLAVWRILATLGVLLVIGAFVLAGLYGNDSLETLRSLGG
ncbi:MAG: rhomboid family intramembrane serine protease [Acidobacteriota bacterium]|jgi:rhomboid protease GluP